MMEMQIKTRHHHTTYLRISNQKDGKMVQWVGKDTFHQPDNPSSILRIRMVEEGTDSSKFCSELHIHTPQ